MSRLAEIEDRFSTVLHSSSKWAYRDDVQWLIDEVKRLDLERIAWTEQALVEARIGDRHLVVVIWALQRLLWSISDDDAFNALYHEWDAAQQTALPREGA